MNSHLRLLVGVLILGFGITSFSACSRYTRVVVVEKSHDGARNHGHAVASDKHFENGVKLYHKGRYKPASKQFKLSVSKNPKNWKSHYYLGLCQREFKAYKKATRHFEMALQRAPRDNEIKAKIFVDMGITWEKHGHNDRAAKFYSKALKHDSKNHDAKAGLKRANKKHKNGKGHRRG